MKMQQLPVYALAVVIAAVGALWLGVPAGTLVVLAVVLVCPLMMIFMMRGMHDMHGGHEQHKPTEHDSDDRRTPTGR